MFYPTIETFRLSFYRLGPFGIRKIFVGLENFKEAVADFTKAFPDLKIEIQDMVAEGDRVAVRFTHRGTHTGATFAGIPPTGKRVVWTCNGIYRVAKGKLVEEWFNEDSLAMMKQLGAIK